MSQRVIRLAQLASTKDRAGLLPVSPATVWRWVREGKFIKPFKLGEGTTVWDAAAVEAFLATRREEAESITASSKAPKLNATQTSSR